MLQLRQARADPAWELPPHPRSPAAHAREIPCSHPAPSARGPVPRLPGSPINVGGPLPPKQLPSEHCRSNSSDIIPHASSSSCSRVEEGNSMRESGGDSKRLDASLPLQLK